MTHLADLMRHAGHPDQLFGTRLLRIDDGPGDGMRVLQVWNAAGLRLEILVDRGFDIHRTEYRALGLHWVGPPGLRSRFAYESQGWGWLRSFHGGLLVTCGLEHVLLPIDRKTPEYNFPVDKTEHFGLHGRVANEGGELLSREVAHAGEQNVLRIKGRVAQATLYGENLWLERQIDVPIFSPEIRISDVVTNRGYYPTHHELLYHINFGYPLIQEGTEVILSTEDGPETITATRPQAGFQEQVTPHSMAVRDGWALAQLVNRELGFTVDFEYSAPSLPHFFVWYMMGEGAY
ncbi:MAG: DUF4432 family protein, partial [Haloechinothrix sp.]